MLDTPPSLLDERRQRGHDRWDEVWNGLLHIVPPPSDWHQRFGTQLLLALAPLAEANGLVASYETGVFHPVRDDRDYRVPDLVFASNEHRSKRGVEAHAALVVEILSENDESYDKLEFYAELRIAEVWIVDPNTRRVDLFVLRGGRYHAALPDARGVSTSPGLGVALTTIPGPRLRITSPDGEHIV